jgi:hypothetical protein
VLQPWDQEFYSRQLAGASPHMQAAAAAAPYLQLASVLSGVDALLHQLMGLRLQLQPLARGEGWAPGVLKLAVSCEQQGPLGTLYLDLLARPGKPAASGILYPLRCGRALRGASASRRHRAEGACSRRLAQQEGATASGAHSTVAPSCAPRLPTRWCAACRRRLPAAGAVPRWQPECEHRQQQGPVGHAADVAGVPHAAA